MHSEIYWKGFRKSGIKRAVVHRKGGSCTQKYTGKVSDKKVVFRAVVHSDWLMHTDT